MYVIQTNFFGGDATFIDNFGKEFPTFDEALQFVLDNKPGVFGFPEHEWNVRIDCKGGAVIWTRYGGEEVFGWIDGKLVGIRDKNGNDLTNGRYRKGQESD